MQNVEQTLIRIFTDTLTTKNQKIYQVGVADHLFLYANTGSVGTLLFSFDQASSQGLLVGQVVSTQVDPSTGQLQKFREVQIINNDTGSTTYTIVIANGAIDFKGLVISTTLTTMQAQTSTATPASDITTGAAAKVFTGAVNLSVILYADITNTATIYFGIDNTVSASKKMFGLEPGAIYIFTVYKGDLWSFSAASQKLSITPLT